MWIQTILILLSLSSMYALGLNIQRKDLGNISDLFPLFIGLLLINFLLLPISAYLVSDFFHLAKNVSIGLFLCSACPGGASAAIFVMRSKGNPTIGGVFIIGLNLVSIILTPILFSIHSGIETGIGFKIVKRLLLISFLIQGLPILLGIWNRIYFPAFSKMIFPWISYISNVCLLLAVGILTFNYYRDLLNFNLKLWVACLSVVLLSHISSLLFSKTDRAKKASISSVTTIRSLSLALLLSEIQFKDSKILLTILLYGIIMYLVTEAGSYIWRKV